MSKKLLHFDQLRQRGTTIPSDQLKQIKGGYTQFTLPGKDLKAGSWTEIDLRIAPADKNKNRIFSGIRGSH
jgi:hypothetical protein